MTREELESLIFDKYGVYADYPFCDDLETGVFRHSTGKWFAIAMNISEKKLGKSGEMQINVVNFKCATEIIESLVGIECGIYPAYHMNKMHWLTVNLSECRFDTVEWLLGISYELTVSKAKSKKRKAEA